MEPIKDGTLTLRGPSRLPGRHLRRLSSTAATLLVLLSVAIGVRAPAGARAGPPPLPGPETPDAAKVSRMLEEIFDEVAELGPNPGEEVVRREFFAGEGDDDTYKDHHLVVLIQDVEGGRKMILQVTRLVPDPDRPRVKYGRDPRTVVCLIKGDRLTMVRSDYSEKELVSFLPELLKAIRDRKKLIRGDRSPAAGLYFPVTSSARCRPRSWTARAWARPGCGPVGYP